MKVHCSVKVTRGCSSVQFLASVEGYTHKNASHHDINSAGENAKPLVPSWRAHTKLVEA